MEFLFYFGISDRFFDQLTVTTQQPVSQPHTRKSFFGRLAAFFAVSSLVPSLFARTATKAVAPTSASASFRLKPDSRAVARNEDSV